MIVPKSAEPEKLNFRSHDMSATRLPNFYGYFRETKTWLMRHRNYTKMMRFTLVDAAERKFVVQRWCFRGGVDDWIGLGCRIAAPLPDLVRTYVQDLGKDIFYDLI